MCDFYALDEAAKTAYRAELTACVDAIGGKNHFLQLLEAVRRTKPHPLTAKHCRFVFARGTVTWNKVIFADKLTLLLKVRVNASKQGNLLPPKEDKAYKKVLNLVRTLNPVEITVTPKKAENGAGFTVHPFDIVDEETTRLNPLFDALFFCSVDTVKKVLDYTPKAS